MRSRLQIFHTCRELTYELSSCRFPRLTPAQSQVKEPISEALPVRKHLVDTLLYLAISNPQWIEPGLPEPAEPLYPGIRY